MPIAHPIPFFFYFLCAPSLHFFCTSLQHHRHYRSFFKNSSLLHQMISNRQRKMRELQAQQSREQAAARQGTPRTPFREAELFYLSRTPAPDFTTALDFRKPVEELLRDHPKIQRVPLHKPLSEISDLFGIATHLEDGSAKEEQKKGQQQQQQQQQQQKHQTDKDWSRSDIQHAYLHADHPGLIYIPAAFAPAAQRKWIKACLQDYTKKPNKSNIDTHYLVPDTGVWDLHEKVFLGRATLEDQQMWVPRKADMDLGGAGGYGTDSSEDETKDQKKEDKNDNNNIVIKGKRKFIKLPTGRTLIQGDQASAAAAAATIPESEKHDVEPSSSVPILPPAELVRKLRWITLGYQYHWPSKTYHFNQNAPFAKDLAEISKSIVRAVEGVGSYSYKGDQFVAEAGVVNYYQLKDRLMGHVDRSELNKDAPLVSFSFGHSCIYLLGGATRDVVPTPILLQSGDILLMTGPCRAAFHGVPRIMEDTLPAYLDKDPNDPEWDIFADYLAQARINLNVRQVFPPKSEGTEGDERKEQGTKEHENGCSSSSGSHGQTNSKDADENGHEHGISNGTGAGTVDEQEAGKRANSDAPEAKS